MRNVILTTCVIMTMGFSSCEVINPADPVPTYVNIEPFELFTTMNQGSSSAKITEGWLYVNNEFLGAYSLPATVPVIAEGTSEVIVFPGIRVNGIQSTPDIYPFYNRYVTEVQLVPTETFTVQPQINYDSDVAFSAIESFEGTHVFLEDLDGDLQTSVVLTDQDAFEGSSGRMTINSVHPEIEVATILRYDDIPINGTPVYLELNYKNDVEFALGLIGVEAGTQFKDYFFIFKPQDEWNKIYIELTERIQLSGFDRYQLVFRALYSADVGQTNTILLDNIKLVHF